MKGRRCKETVGISVQLRDILLPFLQSICNTVGFIIALMGEFCDMF